jgi:formylmethanofuran dehydrogenase subunit B
MDDPTPPARDWIDVFCPLLSDRVGVVPGDPPRPGNPAAGRTARALASFTAASVAELPQAWIGDQPASLDDAVTQAARMLADCHQPLFGGLGTDVAGARALVRLGLRCGAILDHAQGDGMMQALRALQDRGGFSCTLSEVRSRADLIVCIGADPSRSSPDFFARCGIGEPGDEAPSDVPSDVPRERVVVFLRGAGDTGPVDGEALLQGRAGVQVEAMEFADSELHALVAELNVACLQRPLPRPGPHWAAMQALAARLLAARYAVLVYAPGELPGRHAALLVEAISRIAKTLNRTTRAGSLAIAGADGSICVNQVATWLTGLPLRTALHAHGLDHDPHRHSSRRLLKTGAVDGLLWVSSFRPDLLPPAEATAGAPALPLVVLGHPAMAVSLNRGDPKQRRVFIPVSAPGVNAPGQLFRCDGGIALNLKPFMATALPSVADVAQRIGNRLQEQS